MTPKDLADQFPELQVPIVEIDAMILLKLLK